MSQWLKIKPVAVHLAVAYAAIAAAVLAVHFLLLPGIVAVFHAGAEVTSLVRRSGIFVLVLLAYWAVVRFHERRAATELRIAPVGIALGVLSGAALISITTLSLFAVGAYEVSEVRGPQGALLGVAAVIWIAAFLEEVIYRCILFRVLEEAWGTLPALCLQALVFGAMHLANAEADPTELLTTLVSVTLLGAFWSCVYIHTRNLWIVAAHHASWNFAILLVGVPLSGLEDWLAVAPISSRYNGPAWLTGGVFGPENSIITIGVLAIGLAVLWPLARRRNRLVTGTAAGRANAITSVN